MIIMCVDPAFTVANTCIHAGDLTNQGCAHESKGVQCRITIQSVGAQIYMLCVHYLFEIVAEEPGHKVLGQEESMF